MSFVIAFFGVIVLVLMLLLIIAVPLSLGMYVYQDAKSRGMEPLLWALIAVLAPSFIGLIIYLVVRKDHLAAQCPQCGCEVQEGFVSCPSCGQKLSASCLNCGTALRPEWKLCPTCGTEITETEPFTPPVVARPANKKLFGVLLVSLLLPIGLFILLTIVGLLGYVSDSSIVSQSDYIVNDIVNEDWNDDAMLTIVSDFTNKVDYYECNLMPVNEAPLDQEATDWINACKNGEKGIYANTYHLATDGGFVSTLGKGNYNMDYAYTVVVINPEKSVQYVDNGISFEHRGEETWLVTEDIEMCLIDPNTEEDKEVKQDDRKEAKRYDNVFVIQHPYAYTIDYSFKLGKSHHLKAEVQNKNMQLTLEDGNVTENGSATYITKYTIPFDTDENGFYTPFKKDVR